MLLFILESTKRDKIRNTEKCITFEPELRFSKFKRLNRSEFHQCSENRDKSERFLGKFRIRDQIPIFGTINMADFQSLENYGTKFKFIQMKQTKTFIDK